MEKCSHCSFSLLLIISILLELYDEKNQVWHNSREEWKTKKWNISLISLKKIYIFVSLINLIIFYKKTENHITTQKNDEKPVKKWINFFDLTFFQKHFEDIYQVV